MYTVQYVCDGIIFRRRDDQGGILQYGCQFWVQTVKDQGRSIRKSIGEGCTLSDWLISQTVARYVGLRVDCIKRDIRRPTWLQAEAEGEQYLESAGITMRPRRVVKRLVEPTW